eukprot:CAMPEP_0184487202 /NCGR_PEP_ID=MMETSP0113_2-20130426/9464_1 /TAXON_ID=91329 /ORGANISM="Norrisiella sphaerica, Strain BC52" /LENGTH=404 /DNA_ID=CAMNT_0026869409 /DNA_START=225 /DNA_END=1439 /DNA_ORIENTATION=+
MRFATTTLAALIGLVFFMILRPKPRSRHHLFLPSKSGTSSGGQIHHLLSRQSSLLPTSARGLIPRYRDDIQRVPVLYAFREGGQGTGRPRTVSIEHVEPNSPDANVTQLFGSESSLQALSEEIPPLDDVPDSDLGKIALVGAGPGDPNLLTVAAVKLLEMADIVICDRLVSKEIQEMVKGELKIAKKYPGCADLAQKEIYRWMTEGLRNGKNVIRLKIGDPFMFGRGAEEVLEINRLSSGRVKASVVPGVSSVFAAPLLGGATITHRGLANSVVIGTGYGKDKTVPAIVPFQEKTSAVFLMAIGRIKQLSLDLIEKGYPHDTPVVIIEKASCTEQRVVLADLDSAGDLVEEHAVKPPATIVVGEAGRALFPKSEFQHGVVEASRLPIATYEALLEVSAEETKAV